MPLNDQEFGRLVRTIEKLEADETAIEAELDNFATAICDFGTKLKKGYKNAFKFSHLPGDLNAATTDLDFNGKQADANFELVNHALDAARIESLLRELRNIKQELKTNRELRKRA